jgi:hypothetical protein
LFRFGEVEGWGKEKTQRRKKRQVTTEKNKGSFAGFELAQQTEKQI